ncbi:MAG: RNA polymerase sigma-70 factor [Massilibacteroides sp.]|nr:RNA polymerase sigma-70 factor [Massilibacteroides sp.]
MDGKNNINHSEKELLLLIAKGDQRAFADFYDLYYKQIFRVSYYYMKNATACEEVVNDVFFALWKSRTKLVEIENLRTYIYVSTRNTCLKALRIEDKNPLLFDELPIQLDFEESEETEGAIHFKEMNHMLQQAVAQLPERCREIFILTRLEGMKTKEVAKILSISESTIRGQIKLAVKKVSETLKPFFPNLLSLMYVFLSQLS